MHRTPVLVRRLGTFGLALLFASITRAPVVVWKGSGGDDNWSTGDNWVGTAAPAKNGTATVQFTGSTGINPIVDVPWSIAGLELNPDASAFALSGSALTIGSGGITNNNSLMNLTVDNAVILGAAQTWNASGGNLTVNGIVSGAGRLTITGSGVITLSNANTYTGGTAINGGVLSIAADSALGDTAGDVAFDGGTLRIGSDMISARTIALTNSGTIDVAATRSQLDGQITGSGTLRVVDTNGSGSLTLAGIANDYSGGTLVDGSYGNITLVAGAANVFGLGAMTVNGNGNGFTATLDLNGYNQTIASLTGDGQGVVKLSGASLTIDQSGNSTQFAGMIAGTGALTVKDTIGNGTLTLSGWSDYSGRTTVDGSSGNITLAAGTDHVFGSGPITVNGGGHTATLDLNGGDQAVGPLTGDTGGVVNLSYGAGLTIDQNGSPTEFAGAITGDGNLTVQDRNGGGVLTLSGANTYTGGTTVDGLSGSVALLAGAANVFGPGPMTVTGNGNTATLDLNGKNQAIGSLTGGAGGVVDLKGAQLNTGGDNSDTTFAGTISDTGGGGSLVKVGTGTFTLSGVNLYRGGTTISAGTLELGNSRALLRSTLNYSSSGTLSFGTLTDATFGGLSGNKNLALTNTSLDPVALTVGGNGADTTYSGVLSGGSLAKEGTGKLTLSGTNTYSGGTTIYGGTLSISNDRNLGDVSGGVTFEGGMLQTTSSVTSARPITLTGAGTVDVSGTSGQLTGQITGAGVLFVTDSIGGGTLTLSGANTYSGGTVLGSDIGNITLKAGAEDVFGTGFMEIGGIGLNVGTLDLNGYNQRIGCLFGEGGAIKLTNATLTIGQVGSVNDFAGTITGNGGLIVKNTGGGSTELRIFGANTYTGGTEVNGSSGNITLTALNSDVFGTGPITVNGNGHTVTLDLHGNNQTVGSLTGDTNGVVDLHGARLTTGGSGSSTTFAGNISESAVGGSLVKVGTGTFTLSGASTYTGGTTISAGTVLANNASGSAFGTGSVLVASGATLGGSGFIGGFTTIASGGHLAPGNSPGTLTFTNGLTLESGSILDFQIGTVSDLIRVSGGPLTASGSITLNLSNAGDFNALAGGTYTLFDFTGASLGSFSTSDFTFGTLLGGTTLADYSLHLTGSTLDLAYTVTAVPEPSTYATLLGLGALGFAAWRRRRKS